MGKGKGTKIGRVKYKSSLYDAHTRHLMFPLLEYEFTKERSQRKWHTTLALCCLPEELSTFL
jgi:hypothetical protein